MYLRYRLQLRGQLSLLVSKLTESRLSGRIGFPSALVAMMNLHIIPLSQDNSPAKHLLIYRPLLGLAIVGNQAMADIAATLPTLPNPPDTPVIAFLRAIGFAHPDPPPPSNPFTDFHPTTAVLLMTNRCQLRCTYCYAAAGEGPHDELTPDLGRAAIDYVCHMAQELGRPFFEVSFHGGGEPTSAWRVLQECVTYARQRPLPARLALTSNGIWSAHRRAWILSHFDNLSLSVDGRPDTQDRQRPFRSGQGSAALLGETLAALDAAHTPYGIRMTAIAPWSHFPADVHYLCTHTNCQHLQVEPAFNTKRGGHIGGTAADCQAFAAAFLEAFAIAAQAGRHLSYAGARIGLTTTTFCLAPYNALVVTPRGDLVTCYEITNTDHPLAGLSCIGHIINRNVQLDTAAHTHLHQLIAQRQHTCRDCFCYWTCAGDCYTRTFTDQPGSHLLHNSRCQMNQTITQGLLLHHIAHSPQSVWQRYKSAW